MSETKFKGTIAVDFDGVLHGYGRGWQDGTIYDAPVAGAAEAMRRLMDMGYETVVYTTRALPRTVNGEQQPCQAEAVEAYLREHGIPFTRVHREPGKPLCKLFIDDNALRFEGDWNAAVGQAVEILNRPRK